MTGLKHCGCPVGRAVCGSKVRVESVVAGSNARVRSIEVFVSGKRREVRVLNQNEYLLASS